MKQVWQWIEGRTGCGAMVHRALFESIPGGPKWRYSWGTALLYCFFLQVITGFFLWSGYSPSSQTAWESVYYIQNEMLFGWFVRGVHHYSAQAFMVLLGLHILQMVIYKGYRSPRELNFWLLLLMVPLGIAISATGWLLPFDQRGFWASRVSMNITSSAPVIGPLLQRLALGGTDFGHHTLTRFFALHAGFLPPIIGNLLLVHFALQRRHGLASPGAKGKAVHYWPGQFLRDSIVCLGLAALFVFLVFLPRILDAGAHPGVELGAPADPSEQYSAARPEWFMLFLFQFLKLQFLTRWFGEYGEFVGAFLVPGFVITVFFAMPLINRKKFGHRFNLGFVAVLGVCVLSLIFMALRQDANDPDYHAAVADAKQKAERMRMLAQSSAGIPTSGALTLLRNDPLTQGPVLFAQHCASCHRFDGHDGTGKIPKDAQSAADLAGFGSREWIAGLLDPDRIATTNYFGGTSHANGKMVKFVKKDVAGYDEDEKKLLDQAIIALSAEAQLRSQIAADQRDQAIVEAGREAIVDLSCIDCHQYRVKDPDATAPDLTGYASSEWLVGIIRNAAHERYYGEKNDRMPEFGPDGVLSDRDLRLVASWLRGEWYEPSSRMADAGE